MSLPQQPAPDHRQSDWLMDWQIAEDERANPPQGEPEEIPPPTEDEMDRAWLAEVRELDLLGFNPDLTIEEIL